MSLFLHIELDPPQCLSIAMMVKANQEQVHTPLVHFLELSHMHRCDQIQSQIWNKNVEDNYQVILLITDDENQGMLPC